VKREDDIFRTSLKPRLERGLPSSGGLQYLNIQDERRNENGLHSIRPSMCQSQSQSLRLPYYILALVYRV
jgi:hypothetical protein